MPVEVDAGTLVCWLQAGMESTLPHIQTAKAKARALKEKFMFAENETNDTAKQPARDEEEERFKAQRVEQLQRVQDRHEHNYLVAKDAVDKFLEGLRDEAIQATPLIRSRDQDKALWQLTFSRKDRANYCLQDMDSEKWWVYRESSNQAIKQSSIRSYQPTTSKLHQNALIMTH